MASSDYSRLFTVDEAISLLPSLCPLMKRLFHNLDSLKKQSETVVHDRNLSPDTPDFMRRLQENEPIAHLIQEVKTLVGKINGYGCVCKGVEQGLVDFPCLLGGEIVFLCWRYGEETIGYWHRIEDGFAGRRPLLDPDNGSGNISYH